MTLAAFDIGIGVLPIVFFAGTLGAVVNNYRRLQKISIEPAPEGFDSRAVTMQLYFSPLVGGIFATVLYLAFAAQILEGALFPEFKNAGSEYYDFSCFLDSLAFSKNSDAAKALLWSFIAGFSEQFVPNILEGFTKKNTSQNPT